jgi:sec-independent protein translocase protein TatC
MSPFNRLPRDDDMFAETRMSFGEHLDDLRGHLLRALKWFLVAVVASFFVGKYVVRFISEPVEEALIDYHIEYYKQNADKANLLLEKMHKEIDDPKGDQNMRKLSEPTVLRMQVPASELAHFQDQRLRPVLTEEQIAKLPPLDANATITLNVKIRPVDLMDNFHASVAILAKRTVMTSLSAQETFFVYFKVCILTGFVLASPLVFYEIWSFVASGLYQHEKKLVHVYLPASLALFIAGVLICQFAIIPAALQALLSFNLWLNIEPDFRLNEWLSFAILMPVITGLCFQLPMVMYVLGKMGIFTAEAFAAKRKVAIFIMLIVVAIITPSVDPGSLLLIWVPMVVLYELGIWLVRWTVPKREEEAEVPYDPSTSSNGETAFPGFEDFKDDGKK